MSVSRLSRCLLAGALAFAAAALGCARMPAAVEKARKLGTPTAKPAVALGSGLYYIDVKEGTGTPVKEGDYVVVHYTGWLVDGTKFDSSRDRNKPFVFPLGVGRAIDGWDEGMIGMKPGGIRKLIVPPELGYGSQGSSIVPANATLIFEIELLRLR